MIIAAHAGLARRLAEVMLRTGELYIRYQREHVSHIRNFFSFLRKTLKDACELVKDLENLAKRP